MGSGIRLEFAQFGDFDSFDIHRSTSSMPDVDNLPAALVTGLTTMFYFDQTVVVGATYYYRVVARRGSEVAVSDQVFAAAGVTFDDYLTTLEPLYSWKLDEASGTTVTDVGTAHVNGTFSNTGALVYRGKVLRKGHAGAAGFAISAEDVSQVNVVAPNDLQRLTMNSFTWFAWVHPTVATTYNWLFSNWISTVNGTANMRASINLFQFPHNSRVISYGLTIGQTSFIAVVYNVANRTYKFYINGVWYSATYTAPPTSITTATSFQFPAYASYSYFGMRGYLSDLTFFKRALTNAEVENLYGLGLITG